MNLGVQEQNVKTTAQETSPPSTVWRFKLPEKEGVYDVVIEALEPASLRWNKPKTVAERRVQLIVVDDQPPRQRARKRSELAAGDGNRSGQSQLVRQGEIVVDFAGRGAGSVRRRRFANLAASNARRRRAALRKLRRAGAALGGVSAIDQSPRHAAHSGSGISQRRSANFGRKHFGAKCRGRDDVDRPGFRLLHGGRFIAAGPETFAAPRLSSGRAPKRRSCY